MSPVRLERYDRLPGFEHYTTGGKFDPLEPFSYYLATNVTRHLEASRKLPETNLHVYEHVLVAVNEISGQRQLDVLRQLMDERKVLLDSGIYNLAMGHAVRHGMEMDEALQLHPTEVDGFNELYDRYCRLAVQFAGQLWGMIELDLGGPLIKPETRAKIVADTGITPIPVIHPRSDGWGYYDAHASAYDRVCVGNLVRAVGHDRVRLIHALSERARTDHPTTWHHLLGVTPSPLTHATPVRGSCDSSTWLSGIRWANWRTGGMAAMLGTFPPEMRFTRLHEGASDSHRVDGVAYGSATALEAGCRAVREEYVGW